MKRMELTTKIQDKIIFYYKSKVSPYLILPGFSKYFFPVLTFKSELLKFVLCCYNVGMIFLHSLDIKLMLNSLTMSYPK